MSLDEFKLLIPNLGTLAKRPNQLVPYLAYFMEEYEGAESITGTAVSTLFEKIRVRPPKRISDSLAKSPNFIRARTGGYKLSHDGRQHVENTLLSAQAKEKPEFKGTRSSISSAEVPNEAGKASPLSREVFVVHGRDEGLRAELFSLLRALGLHPLEFNEVVRLSGMPAPYTWDAIKIAFSKTQACVVLFTPDEQVSLREDLRIDHLAEDGWQARPNVYIEAGMALALQPSRTILLTVGSPRSASDLSGMQYVNLSGTPASRNKLLNALQIAGCDARSHGDDWLTTGKSSTHHGGS